MQSSCGPATCEVPGPWHCSCDCQAVPNDQMPNSFEDRYCGHLIKYAPQVLPDGRFMAYAIVLRDFAGHLALTMVLRDLPSYATRSEAADLGRLAARHWIDDQPNRAQLA